MSPVELLIDIKTLPYSGTDDTPVDGSKLPSSPPKTETACVFGNSFFAYRNRSKTVQIDVAESGVRYLRSIFREMFSENNSSFLVPRFDLRASSFLSLLSGRRHRVHTSICIFYNHKFYQKNITTILKMKRLSDEEKKSYLKSQEWRGKAGGYSIQGAASYFFPFISGSYSNVVGLPLTETIGLLNGLGFKSPSFLNRSNN